MSRYLFYAVFLSVVMVVLAGTHLYFYLRLVRDTALSTPWPRVFRWVLLGLAVSLVLTFPLSRLLDPPWGRLALFVPYLWMGSIFYLVVLLLGADVVRLLLWLAGKIGWGGWLLADPHHQVRFARVVALVVLAVTLVIDVVALVTAWLPPRLRRFEVQLPGLGRALAGTRVVQLTDLHLGTTLGREYLEEVVERVAALEPDLVVLTGDAVDGLAGRRAYMVQPLARLHPPLGKYFVTGNHEFYSDWLAWRPVFEKLGFELLDNRCRTISRGDASLRLAGVYDFDGGRFDPAWRPDLDRALAGCPGTGPLLLLSHQARIVEAAAARGVDLVLAGHSHGGQIWPWSYLVLMQQPVIAGLHRFGSTWLYVSQGTGFWGPPLRFLTRSEITLIVLRGDTANTP